MADKVVLKYVGKGRTIYDIPKRDLTQAEVDRYAGAYRLIKTGWWVEVKDEPKPTSRKVKQDEQTET